MFHPHQQDYCRSLPSYQVARMRAIKRRSIGGVWAVLGSKSMDLGKRRGVWIVHELSLVADHAVFVCPTTSNLIRRDFVSFIIGAYSGL